MIDSPAGEEEDEVARASRSGPDLALTTPLGLPGRLPLGLPGRAEAEEAEAAEAAAAAAAEEEAEEEEETEETEEEEEEGGGLGVL